jgi:hypothetical protein
VDIEVLGGGGQPIGQGPLIFDGEDGSENILAGPGTFSLEITAEDASYDITVEDCVGSAGSPGGPSGGPQGPVDSPKGVMPDTTVPKIPNTGGPPLVFGAALLLGVALVVGRGVLRR